MKARQMIPLRDVPMCSREFGLPGKRVAIRVPVPGTASPVDKEYRAYVRYLVTEDTGEERQDGLPLKRIVKEGLLRLPPDHEVEVL